MALGEMRRFWSVRAANALRELAIAEVGMGEIRRLVKLPRGDRLATHEALNAIRFAMEGWKGCRFWWWRYGDQVRANRINKMTFAMELLRRAQGQCATTSSMQLLGRVAHNIDALAHIMMDREVEW